MHRSRTSCPVAGQIALGFGLAACGAGPAAVTPVAPASCPAGGEVVLASQADVARWRACTALGRVVIRSGAAFDVSPLELASIADDLVIGPTVAVDRIALGGLRTVGGVIRVVGNGQLHGLGLPQLERAGRIDIDGNAALTVIALPRLTEVAGALQITDNASLALIDVPALASVGGALVVTGNPSLAVLAAGALRSAAGVELDAPNLPGDVAQAVRAAAR